MVQHQTSSRRLRNLLGPYKHEVHTPHRVVLHLMGGSLPRVCDYVPAFEEPPWAIQTRTNTPHRVVLRLMGHSLPRVCDVPPRCQSSEQASDSRDKRKLVRESKSNLSYCIAVICTAVIAYNNQKMVKGKTFLYSFYIILFFLKKSTYYCYFFIFKQKVILEVFRSVYEDL